MLFLQRTQDKFSVPISGSLKLPVTPTLGIQLPPLTNSGTYSHIANPHTDIYTKTQAKIYTQRNTHKDSNTDPDSHRQRHTQTHTRIQTQTQTHTDTESHIDILKNSDITQRHTDTDTYR